MIRGLFVLFLTLGTALPCSALSDDEIEIAFENIQSEQRYFDMPMTLTDKGDQEFEKLFFAMSSVQKNKYLNELHDYASSYFSGTWTESKKKMAQALLTSNSEALKDLGINVTKYLKDSETVVLRQKAYKDILLTFIDTPISLPNPSEKWTQLRRRLNSIHSSNRPLLDWNEEPVLAMLDPKRTPSLLLDPSQLEEHMNEQNILVRYNLASLMNLPINQRQKNLLEQTLVADLERAQHQSNNLQNSDDDKFRIEELLRMKLLQEAKLRFDDTYRWGQSPALRVQTISVVLGSNPDLWKNPQIRKAVLDYVGDSKSQGAGTLLYRLAASTDYDVHKDEDYRSLIRIAAKDSRYTEVLDESLLWNPHLLHIPELSVKYTDQFLERMTSKTFSDYEKRLLTLLSRDEISRFNHPAPLLLSYINAKYALMPKDLRMKIATNMAAPINAIASQIPEPTRKYYKALGEKILQDPDTDISNAYVNRAYKNQALPQDRAAARTDLIEAHSKQALRGQARAALLSLSTNEAEHLEATQVLGINETEATELKKSFSPRPNPLEAIFPHLKTSACHDALD